MALFYLLLILIDILFTPKLNTLEFINYNNTPTVIVNYAYYKTDNDSISNVIKNFI